MCLGTVANDNNESNRLISIPATESHLHFKFPSLLTHTLTEASLSMEDAENCCLIEILRRGVSRLSRLQGCPGAIDPSQDPEGAEMVLNGRSLHQGAATEPEPRDAPNCFRYPHSVSYACSEYERRRGTRKLTSQSTFELRQRMEHFAAKFQPGGEDQDMGEFFYAEGIGGSCIARYVLLVLGT